MHAFLVELRNRPGELARVAETIARGNINIVAVGGAAHDAICLTTDDDDTARRALVEARYLVRDTELVTVTLADRPGTLAEAARRLGDAGINIEALVPIELGDGSMTVGVATDNPAKTRLVLGEVILAGASR